MNSNFKRVSTQQEDHRQFTAAKPSEQPHEEDVSHTLEAPNQFSHHNTGYEFRLGTVLAKSTIGLIVVALLLIAWWSWSLQVNKFQQIYSQSQRKKENPEVLSNPLQSSIQPGHSNQTEDRQIRSGPLLMSRTAQELENIIKQMQNPADRPFASARSSKKISKVLEDQVYFAWALSKEPENQNYIEAEFHYFNMKYAIGEPTPELPICLVVVGRNLGDHYKQMLDSVARQNYSNFHVIYVDDNSDDGTGQKVKDYSQSPRLNFKMTVIQQPKRMFALFNRNMAIRQHCLPEDIVLDVDADDYLIGNQVFKLVNKLYQDNSTWACYFNNIIYSQQCECPTIANTVHISEQTLVSNSYRQSKVWRTTELRTFRKRLYDKIDQADFVDPATSRYFEWKSDTFMHISIVELCGNKHVKFIDEFVYFYQTRFSKPSPSKSYARLSARTLPPYLPLDSLDQTSSRQLNFIPPQQLMQQLKTMKLSQSLPT